MERIIMGGWVNFKTLKNSNVKIGGDRSELIGFFLPLTLLLLLLVHPSTVFFWHLRSLVLLDLGRSARSN